MAQWAADAVNFLGSVLSGHLLVAALLGTGLYLTLRLGGVQLAGFIESLRLFLPGRNGAGGGITPFQAFATGLASRVGTGNIAGVAVALTAGGPGAIFWMWVTAIVGMASAFSESTLAQIFKVPHGDDTFRGGPAFYIHKGLNSRAFAVVFALSLLFAFGFALNSVQANSIAEALEASFGWSRVWVGVGLVLMTAPIIFGGIRRVAVFAQYIVPLMAVIYIGLSAYVVILNFDAVPGVLMSIFRHAFGLEQAVGGVAGYAVSQAVLMGVRRGLFSNEAGMGSAPNAAAVATTAHPVQQGLLQMFGVFFDTMIVCSGTAALILLSGAYEPGAAIQGAALTQRAMAVHVGEWGVTYMAITVFFLAYSSVLGNYAYAEVNLDYLTRRPWAMHAFRVVVLVAVMAGSVSGLPLVWGLADVSTALMALINVVAVLLLSRHVVAAWRDYRTQRTNGVLAPVFSRECAPELEKGMHPAVWRAPVRE